MPIVKCMGCGKFGHELISRQEIERGVDIKVWLKQRICGHCGQKRLVRAVWGKDYGFKKDGTRFGAEGLNAEHRTSNVE